KDQGGIWTIGYGHTGPEVKDGLIITQTQSDDLLEADIASAVGCVRRLVKSVIHQNQFDALVDFVFNLGCSSLAESILLRYVNECRFEEATVELLRWNHVRGVVVKGLTKRRQAEADLFKKGESGS
ncbi:MAG TPA: lysozyme, partial [Edaphobacter sp.]|nr:lysozyme [Edaphobacter sp.]